MHLIVLPKPSSINCTNGLVAGGRGEPDGREDGKSRAKEISLICTWVLFVDFSLFQSVVGCFHRNLSMHITNTDNSEKSRTCNNFLVPINSTHTDFVFSNYQPSADIAWGNPIYLQSHHRLHTALFTYATLAPTLKSSALQTWLAVISVHNLLISYLISSQYKLLRGDLAFMRFYLLHYNIRSAPCHLFTNCRRPFVGLG